MKNSVQITKVQLIEMLKNWKGAQPASISYITNPKLTKEGTEKFGIVKKRKEIFWHNLYGTVKAKGLV